MLFSILCSSLAFAISAVYAHSVRRSTSGGDGVTSTAAPGLGLKNFTSLVVFGDSYSDESRFNYFVAHNGSAPPVGYANPVNYHAFDGGRPWPEYVKQYTNYAINLYDYAVGGAICDSAITPKYFGVAPNGFPFPDVKSYEIPAYMADAKYMPNGKPFVTAPPASTVYSMWIGTNDLGADAFISDSQVPGKTIVDYDDCVFDQLERVYQLGGRNFVLFNQAPLNLAPLYALPNRGGVKRSPMYWPDKGSNLTEYSLRMQEEVVQVDAVYQYRTPVAVQLAGNFTGAKVAIYDVHGLMVDIYNHPSMYLNGSAPLNVTGVVHQCDEVTGTNCTTSPSPDSFMWYDDLHFSEQVARIIARNFLGVLNGTSKWGTYFSG